VKETSGKTIRASVLANLSEINKSVVTPQTENLPFQN
jgi:hypothetical protein